MKTLLTVILLCASMQMNAGVLDEILESASAREQHQETSVASDIEVIELLRVETPEELEAQLADGYPMPWLEDILNDESIPEEDRYWLDCRIRAAIAQDLHLFFDREGNPVHVEADWMGPGEMYWREHMMIDPLGETDVPDEDRPTNPVGEPGYILDLYGNRVGELATVHDFASLSRDASIAVIPSDYTTANIVSRQSHACFMYPDGSFKEVPFARRGTYKAVVSVNGEVAAFTCTSPSGLHDPMTGERTGIVGDVYFYDPDGNMINSVSPPALIQGGGKFSSTGSYFCTRLSTGEIFLINLADGYSSSLIGMSEGGRGRSFFSFSPDGKYLCAGGFSTGMVIELESSDTVWVSTNEFVGINDNVRVNCSNGAACIVSTTQHGNRPNYYYELELYLNSGLNYTDTIEQVHRNVSVVSPNGYFLLSYMEEPQVRNPYKQMIIRQIRVEEYDAQGN